MNELFKNISSSEYAQLTDAIVWITVYVAGADNKFEPKETEWAEKLTKIRSYSYKDSLIDFYKDVGVDFSDRLQQAIEDLPKELEPRNSILTDRISAVNPILSKLDPKLGADLYSTYSSFAKHVAKSSGGFLRFFSIGSKEKEAMGLSMLDQIVYEEE